MSSEPHVEKWADLDPFQNVPRFITPASRLGRRARSLRDRMHVSACVREISIAKFVPTIYDVQGTKIWNWIKTNDTFSREFI